MVSLKTKSPFDSGIEIFSTKTWIGVGAFCVVAGIAYAGIKMVTTKAEAVKNPVDSIWDKVNG